MLRNIHKRGAAALLAAALALCLCLSGCGLSAAQKALSQIQGGGQPGASSGTAPAETPVPGGGPDENPGGEGPGAPASGGEFLSVTLERCSDWRYAPDNYDIRLCTAEWDGVRLGEESARAYPALDAALRRIYEETAEEFKNTADEMAELALYALEDAIEEGESPDYNWTERVTVQRADPAALGLLYHMMSYEGGIHPYMASWGLNLDPKTGRELTLGQVFRDPDALPALVAGLLTEQYGGEDEMLPPNLDLQQYLAGCIKDGTLHWVIGYQGVTFWFTPYELLPFSAGEPSVSVWFAEQPELFCEEMLPAYDQYAIPLSVDQKLPFDLDSRDGQTDTLELLREPGPAFEDMGEVLPTVLLNGEWVTLTVDDYGSGCADFAAALLHLGEGRNLLYIDAELGGGYHVLSVYDLAGLRLAGRYPNAGFCWDWEDTTGGLATETITNPAAFRLGRRTELLSTITAQDNYAADAATGLPVLQGEGYDLSSGGVILLTKRPIEVQLLPAGKPGRLPAGVSLELLRTDDESYVDAQLEDGRECRILVDAADWPVTVGGVPIEDCFDGMMFAG